MVFVPIFVPLKPVLGPVPIFWAKAAPARAAAKSNVRPMTADKTVSIWEEYLLGHYLYSALNDDL